MTEQNPQDLMPLRGPIRVFSELFDMPFLQGPYSAPEVDAQPPRADASTPKVQPRPKWDGNVPVEDIRPGDHIEVRGPKLYGRRVVVSVKPHPKGGVQIKSTPYFLYLNRCDNPAGKIQKLHLTGYCDRWDGRTMYSPKDTSTTISEPRS